jgi:hypothetical protein
MSAEEDAADRLVYLDPKTPAAYDPSFLHAADDDDDDEEYHDVDANDFLTVSMKL